MGYIIICFKIQIYYISSRSPLALKVCESPSVMSDSAPYGLYTLHGILHAKIPVWVAIPFSRVSSQPRGRTQVSYIAGGFFTS